MLGSGPDRAVHLNWYKLEFHYLSKIHLVEIVQEITKDLKYPKAK